jgi:hypothetical protein
MRAAAPSSRPTCLAGSHVHRPRRRSRSGIPPAMPELCRARCRRRTMCCSGRHVCPVPMQPAVPAPPSISHRPPSRRREPNPPPAIGPSPPSAPPATWPAGRPSAAGGTVGQGRNGASGARLRRRGHGRRSRAPPAGPALAPPMRRCAPVPTEGRQTRGRIVTPRMSRRRPGRPGPSMSAAGRTWHRQRSVPTGARPTWPTAGQASLERLPRCGHGATDACRGLELAASEHRRGSTRPAGPTPRCGAWPGTAASVGSGGQDATPARTAWPAGRRGRPGRLERGVEGCGRRRASPGE